MPLIMKFRRYWAIFFFAVLLLPTVGFFAPDLPAPVRTVVAPEEQWWAKASQRLDPYINNVFGFRGAVLQAHNTYGRWLGGGDNERVMKGEDGALFIKDDWALEQSIGQILRKDAVAELADVMSELDRYMKSTGKPMVMMMPPNSQTVNSELLPAYARELKRSPTEYDLLATALKDKGVTFVDLRPILTDAKKDGPIYRQIDTHWNARGAVLAFNAAMEGAGRPNLAFNLSEVLGPTYERKDGDLLRLMGGVEAEKPDLDYERIGAMASAGKLTPIEGVMPPTKPTDPFQSKAFTTGHDGPRIMVIGDSFTQGFWPGLLAARSSAYAWMHHRNCQFDRGAVERFKPDILIYAITERSLPCKPAKN